MKILRPECVNTDNRRTLTQLFTADIKQVNLYEVSAKAILGEHYHKETKEFFFITKGTFILQVGSPKSRLHTARSVNKGDLFVVEPGEKHTLECLSKEGSFLTFLTKPYANENPDTFKE